MPKDDPNKAKVLNANFLIGKVEFSKITKKVRSQNPDTVNAKEGTHDFNAIK